MLKQGSIAIRDVSRLSYVCFFQECMTEYVRLCKLMLRIFMIFFISLIHIYHASEGPAQQHASACKTHPPCDEYLSAQQQWLQTWHSIGKTNKYGKIHMKKKKWTVFYQHSSKPGFSCQIYSSLLTYNVKVTSKKKF